MWVGHNNYFWDKNAHVENTIADIKKAATSLARLGAEHIVIGKMARLGDSPAVYAGKGKPKKTLREFSENHNDELINVIKDLKNLPGDKSYYTFDAFSVSIATQENPDDYGFQELKYPCYRGNIFGFYPDPKFCQKPFTTKYWDEAHPNTVMFCYYALRFLEDVSMSEGLFSENRKVCQSLTEDESLDQD